MIRMKYLIYPVNIRCDISHNYHNIDKTVACLLSIIRRIRIRKQLWLKET